MGFNLSVRVREIKRPAPQYSPCAGADCRRPTVVIWTKYGKAIRCDPRLLAPDGRTLRVFDDGVVAIKHPQDPERQGRRLHQATCLNSQDFIPR